MLAPQRISLLVWIKELFTGRMACCRTHYDEEELKKMDPNPVDRQLKWKEFNSF